MTKLLDYKLTAILLLVMTTGISAVAQYTHQQEQPDKGVAGKTLNAQAVKTGLYMFSSDGSNSLLRLTGRGSILIDGQPAAYYDNLRARIRKISDQPVLALVLTDRDESHIGTNAKLLEYGARIIAQENLKRSLIADYPHNDKGEIPLITYDQNYQIKLGGVEVQLFHFGSAHTNSDTVAYFPNLKVVAVGDLFAATPNPDFSAGGSLVGWSSVLAQVLKLDFDTVVPGSGPVATRAQLEAFKAKIDDLLSRAGALVKKGTPKDQLMAALNAGDASLHLSLTPGQLDHFYAELSSADAANR